MKKPEDDLKAHLRRVEERTKWGWKMIWEVYDTDNNILESYHSYDDAKKHMDNFNA